ncbi:MAG TPA: hypothetical protein VHV51_02525 [Polyangiaceae bacterium]|nr:hypothetical protein [Polyangiaceae bacterium]
MIAALPLFSACKAKQHTPKLPPLRAEAWLVELDVPGFAKAELAVPLGATEPRPIVIALHGAADRPEWACGAWRSVAGPQPFVLCPRGVERADFKAPDLRYTFGTTAATASELRAGLAALKARFGAHVAAGPVVIAGFEIGADRAAEIAQQEPTFFSRVALVNPAPNTWPPAQSSLFGREGGERVLFACGTGARTATEFKAVFTRRAGADARAIFLSESPPSLDAAGVAQLKTVWPWLDAPSTHRVAPENLAGNPISAKRPQAPRLAPN